MHEVLILQHNDVSQCHHYDLLNQIPFVLSSSLVNSNFLTGVVWAVFIQLLVLWELIFVHSPHNILVENMETLEEFPYNLMEKSHL